MGSTEGRSIRKRLRFVLILRLQIQRVRTFGSVSVICPTEVCHPLRYQNAGGKYNSSGSDSTPDKAGGCGLIRDCDERYMKAGRFANNFEADIPVPGPMARDIGMYCLYARERNWT